MPKVINTIVKFLIISDFVFNFGWGLMAPIFAIFVLQSIHGISVSEAVQVAGFSSFCYWVTKSIFQIPIGHYLDKNHGEIDDFWFLFIGTLMTAAIPIGYLFATQPWHIYILQVFYGIAAAMTLPSFAAMFTRHITKGKEALTWSTYSTFIGVAVGISGGIGGIAVATFGFKPVFISISIFTVLSNVAIVFIKKDLSKRNKNIVRIPIEK